MFVVVPSFLCLCSLLIVCHRLHLFCNPLLLALLFACPLLLIKFCLSTNAL